MAHQHDSAALLLPLLCALCHTQLEFMLHVHTGCCCIHAGVFEFWVDDARHHAGCLTSR
jgi:hypothetical protein